MDDLQGELGGAKKRIRKLEKERDVAISSLRSELSREVEEATKFLLQQLDGRGGAAPQGELPAAAAREIRQLKEEVASLQAGYAELSSSSARPLRKSTTSSTWRWYRSGDTSSTHGPRQRPIWCSRHVRARLRNSLSGQVRRRKWRFNSRIVSRIDEAEA